MVATVAPTSQKSRPQTAAARPRPICTARKPASNDMRDTSSADFGIEVPR